MPYRKGFTLIEIIVVLIIIAILSALAIPNYVSYIQQKAAIAAQNNLISIYNGEKNYYMNNGSYCIGTCDTQADINTNLNLNISDNVFTTYSCAAVNGFTCTATSPSIAGFSLAISGGTANAPIPIVLTGATTCATPATGTNCNPACLPNTSIDCP